MYNGYLYSGGKETTEIKFSNIQDPTKWDTKGVKIIKFPFNIEKFLRWLLRKLETISENNKINKIPVSLKERQELSKKYGLSLRSVNALLIRFDYDISVFDIPERIATIDPKNLKRINNVGRRTIMDIADFLYETGEHKNIYREWKL